ncbi:hypothetical protein GCM10022205_58570 [Spinactinospora alkalitolerans]
MRVLLLSLLVFAHFLCSVCHAAVAIADSPADAGAVPAAVQTAEATAGGVALHSSDESDEDGRSVCATEGDVSIDQRLTAAKMLMLLGLGAVLVAALWLAPPRPGPWLVRRLLAATRSGPPLLLSLCIQRV